MYKLKDLQGSGLKEDYTFKNKKEVVQNLTDYHNQDFTGTDNKDKELTLPQYFRFWKINTTQKQLDWLLDYGMWELIKI